jgi:serine/threonine protein kinase
VQLAETTPSFQVFGYYEVQKQIAVVPLTGHVSVTKSTLANLFYASVEFALGLDQALPHKSHELPFAGGTGGTSLFDKTRVKVINYNSTWQSNRFTIDISERRSPKHSVSLLPKCTHLKAGEHLDIIIWPHIVGDHKPYHSSCVAACISHLASAHSNNVLHCDLHRGNFVFNENQPELSRIIDWDHARNSQSPGLYVAGWQMLPERHKLAQAGSPVDMAHERYSLMMVMKQFVVIDERAVAWTALCDRAGFSESLLELAKDVLAFNGILSLRGDAPTIDVTGSPPRARHVLPSVGEE